VKTMRETLNIVAQVFGLMLTVKEVRRKNPPF